MPKTKTALVVDDEASVRQIVNFALRRAGFTVLEASNASEAKEVIYESQPDIALLDWMMPGQTGIELARTLKRDPLTSSLPIIMLTAKADESDVLAGLDMADDYITKPFSPRELVARIHAVMRRTNDGESTDETLVQGNLHLNIASHRVTVHRVTVENAEEPDNSKMVLELGPTEFRLLHFFMRSPDRVFSRTQVLDNVWGQNVYVEERTVDVHIRRLRKALEPSGCEHYVQTVRGVGYRFTVSDAADEDL